MLEDTAKTAENRAPTSAALAAFRMAIQQEREFQEGLKESVERRKQEAAEAARQAAEERARANGSDRSSGEQRASADSGTESAGSEGGGAEGQTANSVAPDRGTAVNIEV